MISSILLTIIDFVSRIIPWVFAGLMFLIIVGGPTVITTLTTIFSSMIPGTAQISTYVIDSVDITSGHITLNGTNQFTGIGIIFYPIATIGAFINNLATVISSGLLMILKSVASLLDGTFIMKFFCGLRVLLAKADVAHRLCCECNGSENKTSNGRIIMMPQMTKEKCKCQEENNNEIGVITKSENQESTETEKQE